MNVSLFATIRLYLLCTLAFTDLLNLTHTWHFLLRANRESPRQVKITLGPFRGYKRYLNRIREFSYPFTRSFSGATPAAACPLVFTLACHTRIGCALFWAFPLGFVPAYHRPGLPFPASHAPVAVIVLDFARGSHTDCICACTPFHLAVACAGKYARKYEPHKYKTHHTRRSALFLGLRRTLGLRPDGLSSSRAHGASACRAERSAAENLCWLPQNLDVWFRSCGIRVALRRIARKQLTPFPHLVCPFKIL